VPGPACYGRSSVPTLTDANFLLGRIPQIGLLGGRMRLDIERARKAIGTIASSLNTSVLDAAEGIVQVTDSNLERAVRVISVEKGHNPREFTLIAFGGAGPLHSANLAMRLNIKKVIIPKFPGAFSALGLLFADVVRDYSLTVFKKTEAKRGEEFQHLFEPLIKKANYEMSKGGFNLSDLTYIKSLDMRYVGQSYEINIPLVSTLDEHFHRAHRKEFSYCDRSREVEIVTIRLRVVAKSPKPRLVKKPVRPRKPVAKETEVYLNGRKRMINLYERESLCAGDLLTSPCIVTEYSATTFVPQGFYAEVDAYENIVLEMV
jgi:N-methylhydantoinase A